MINIKGEVADVRKSKGGGEIFLLKNPSGFFTVKSAKKTDIHKGDTATFLNLEKRKGLIKTTYEITEETLVFLHPEIFVNIEEMKLANFCYLAPVFANLTGIEQNNEEKELLFYKGIKGKTTNEHISQIAKRYPKELKGKFSYKQFMYDNNTGFLINNVLHFGKFPLVFSGDEEKGKILALSSKNIKYVVINEKTGTMQEKKITAATVSEIANKRNKIIRKLLCKNSEEFFKEPLTQECPLNCPLYEYCKQIKSKPENVKIFEKYLRSLLKKEALYRKIFIKTLTSGNNPLTGSTKVSPKNKKAFELNDRYIYNLAILSNEAGITSHTPAVLSERPPLDRKTICSVENVSYKEMEISAKNEILLPETISPLPGRKYPLRGIFDFAYSENSPLKYFQDKKSNIDIYESKEFIKDDPIQNEAVNKIINMHGLFALTGEHGTGKKYVSIAAISELLKYGKTFLIVTQSRKKEMQRSITTKFGKFVGENGAIKIYGIDEKVLQTEKPSFDYVIVSLDSPVEKSILQSVMGKAGNVVFLTPPNFIPFEEKIPETNRINLVKEYRFGNHILHFLQPIMTQKLEPSADIEIKPNDTKKAEKKFFEIINPSKFVLYVNVKGKERGNANKWNAEEAQFAVYAAKEFIKTGIDPSQIEIIVPYERQKSYLEYLLDEDKMQKLTVSLPSESEERDIVFILFTDTRKIGGAFSNNALLKIALTRARSKLILTGSRGIHKTSKLLSKIL